MKPLKILILFGIVSLLADVTYEGTRSILGPFLNTLGATGFLIGIISGAGELIGYGIRIISGYLSDKTKKWWSFTIIGYGINLIAIPLLSITKNLSFASFLILLERFGKAIRTPSRDTILSFVSSKFGHGKGFGIHEALDQIGAIIGPLIVWFIFYLNGGFKESFLTLGFFTIPCILILIFLKKNVSIEEHTFEYEKEPGKKIFYLYLFFIFFTTLGFLPFQLASYHLIKFNVFQIKLIPFLFSIAMATDAISSLISGFLFDKKGIKILIFVPVFTMVSIILIFLKNSIFCFFGVLFWGFVLGMQESILRAGIAKISSIKKRGFYYGIFNSIYGFSFFIGSSTIGFLYDLNINFSILFSIFFNLISVLIFLKLKKLWNVKN